MVAELEFAKKGLDFRLNWRDVNKVVHRTNALLNMNALMEGRTRGVGQLAVLGDLTDLTIFTSQGGFGPTVPVSITVTSNKNPAIVGDSVNFTAQIVPTLSISISATGTVQFRIDGIDFGVPVTLVAGQATSANTTSLTKGDHLVEAIYSGDDNFFSNTGQMTESIKYAVSLALTSNHNPSTTGQAVQWTATLTGTNINSATGTVQFYVDGQPFGAAVNVSSGKALSQNNSSLGTGSHSIQAHYSGDTNYSDADASTLTQSVNVYPQFIDYDGFSSPTAFGVTYSMTNVRGVVYDPAHGVTQDNVDPGAPVQLEFFEGTANLYNSSGSLLGVYSVTATILTSNPSNTPTAFSFKFNGPSASPGSYAIVSIKMRFINPGTGQAADMAGTEILHGWPSAWDGTYNKYQQFGWTVNY